MRVLVCGGRDYDDWKSFCSGMAPFVNCDCIISGGAPGADSMAIEWAGWHERPLEVFKAEWERYGRSAGPRRNIKMVREGKPDLVIAFPGGKGTAHMVSFATEEGIEVIDLRYKLRPIKLSAEEVRDHGGTVP